MELKKVVVYNGFVVTSASMLNDNDRKILTLLYQPLCGYGALSLYFTLWSKYESIINYKVKCDHKNLFNNMKYKRKFNEKRRRINQWICS